MEFSVKTGYSRYITRKIASTIGNGLPEILLHDIRIPIPYCKWRCSTVGFIRSASKQKPRFSADVYHF